ncbi:hypothetical protein EUX98_g4610 [Antrodiella citrinella]|uniref:GTP-binding protein n=1 Tax=Antrodiella citrinella TaxID=2447956 RepID=A0A4S4MTM2_9APHY|nr:hypothetical protein EUX98_g4610 [Antrodiella citrinella]
MKKKVLLMGASGSGKTSMRSLIFSNNPASLTSRLGATIDVEQNHVRFLGDLILNLWDCGGQDAFMDSYLSTQQSTIFSHVGVLIYVFEVESRNMQKDLEYYTDCLKALRKYSPEANVFLLVHKMDLVRAPQKRSVLEKKAKDLRQLENMPKKRRTEEQVARRRYNRQQRHNALALMKPPAQAPAQKRKPQCSVKPVQIPATVFKIPTITPLDWARKNLWNHADWESIHMVSRFVKYSGYEDDETYAARRYHLEIANLTEVEELPVDLETFRPSNTAEAWFQLRLLRDRVSDNCTSEGDIMDISRHRGRLAMAYAGICGMEPYTGETVKGLAVVDMVRMAFGDDLPAGPIGEIFRVTFDKPFRLQTPHEDYMAANHTSRADLIVSTHRITDPSLTFKNVIHTDPLIKYSFLPGLNKTKSYFDSTLVLFAKESAKADDEYPEAAQMRLEYTLVTARAVLMEWGVEDPTVFGITQVGSKVQFWVCAKDETRELGTDDGSVDHDQLDVNAILAEASVFGPCGPELDLTDLYDFFSFYNTLCAIRDTRVVPLAAVLRARDMGEVLSGFGDRFNTLSADDNDNDNDDDNDNWCSLDPDSWNQYGGPIGDECAGGGSYSRMDDCRDDDDGKPWGNALYHDHEEALDRHYDQDDDGEPWAIALDRDDPTGSDIREEPAMFARLSASLRRTQAGLGALPGAERPRILPRAMADPLSDVEVEEIEEEIEVEEAKAEEVEENAEGKDEDEQSIKQESEQELGSVLMDVTVEAAVSRKRKLAETVEVWHAHVVKHARVTPGVDHFERTPELRRTPLFEVLGVGSPPPPPRVQQPLPPLPPFDDDALINHGPQNASGRTPLPRVLGFEDLAPRPIRRQPLPPLPLLDDDTVVNHGPRDAYGRTPLPRVLGFENFPRLRRRLNPSLLSRRSSGHPL